MRLSRAALATLLAAAAACANSYEQIGLTPGGAGGTSGSSASTGGGAASTGGDGVGPGGSSAGGLGPGGTASGGAGTGGAVPCAAGMADCTGSDGICETDLSSDQSCGGCGWNCITLFGPGFACYPAGNGHECGCTQAGCNGGTCDPVTKVCSCSVDGECAYGETCFDSAEFCGCGDPDGACHWGFLCINGSCFCDVYDYNGANDGGAEDCNGGSCNPNTSKCVCGARECAPGVSCDWQDSTKCEDGG